MDRNVPKNEFRPRLGRGLAALIGDKISEETLTNSSKGFHTISVDQLRSNPNNPRTTFGEAELDELASSIRQRGMLQPIIARVDPKDSAAFEIVAGERRWRAAQRANIHSVPVLLVEVTDRDALEIAIVENVQRSDLNALDEARGYDQLAQNYGYTHDEIATLVGKSRSHIANTLRLLAHPPAIKTLIADGIISAGHARALLAVSDPEDIARQITSKRLTVRDVERLGANPRRAVVPKRPSSSINDTATEAMEVKLSLSLGAKVTLRYRGEKGEIQIQFNDFEQLDALCERLIS